MKIIKNINNNYAVAIDSDGNQLIVSGKGIGFGPVPRMVKDITIINRSYYDIDETYITMINDIPDEIIDISSKIIDTTRSVINNPISSNIVFTLADHIHFSIERFNKNMNIKLPIIYDVQHLFEKEYKIGLYGLKLIKNQLNVYLPKEEAVYIALHIINAEKQEENTKNINEEIINDITKIVENDYFIVIDKDNFNYSRFVSHMHYLLKRGKSKHLIESKNDKLYQTMVHDYPKTYECSKRISEYLENKLKLKLTDEEKLYLMLHINRLCTREDCNQ